MDEPTAALADHEVELLYRIIRELTSRGVAIVYVSHRLREVLDLCDTVIVLKDGQQVDTAPRRELDEARLVRLMVGRPMYSFFPDPAPGHDASATPRLQLRGAGNGYVDGIDLTLRGGEIVGVAGLQGSGRTELLEAIFGIEPFTRGEVRSTAQRHPSDSPRRAIRAGLALVTEDRKATGLALQQSLLDNALGVVHAVFPRRTDTRSPRGAPAPGIAGGRGPLVVPGGAVPLRREPAEGRAGALADHRTRGVVLLDEPTRGIDVGAKHAIYEVMRESGGAGGRRADGVQRAARGHRDVRPHRS